MPVILFLLFFISNIALADVDFVKVEKSKNKLYLLDDGKIVKEYHVAFGANPKGHKQQEDDKKTPEGIYQLDYKKEDSSFYRAMHISYPNKQDTINASKRGVSAGGLIMIHGQPNYLGWLGFITQRFNWTNGCIALSNSDVDEFMALVNVGTKIEIKW